MAVWLRELRDKTTHTDQDIILHIIGTKSDVVAEDPSKREVPFERCIGYVAEQLYPDIAAPSSTLPANDTEEKNSRGRPGTRSRPSSMLLNSPPPTSYGAATMTNLAAVGFSSPNSNRSSGFWGQEALWDCCHEISAKDGEGIEEVFRVITRKLVEQHQRRLDQQRAVEATMGITPGFPAGTDPQSYFDLPGGGAGSFRLGAGDKRRSWLGFPSTPGPPTASYQGDDQDLDEQGANINRGRCC